MTVAWLVCMAGWAVIALWPTHFSASAVIYADLAELTGDGQTAVDGERLPAKLLEDLLLSEENLRGVQDNVSLDPQKSGTLRDDIMFRPTAPPLFVAAYEHRDPKVAHDVLETLLLGFKTRVDEAASASGEEAVALDEQIDEQTRKLEVADAELEAFRRGNSDHLDGADDRNVAMVALQKEARALRERLDKATADRDRVAASLAKAPDAESGAVPTGPALDITALEAERTALETELEKLRERYADSHPYVVAATEGLETLDDKLEAASSAPALEPAGDRNALEQKHGELIADVSTLSSRLRTKRRELDLLQALTRATSSVEAELSSLESAKEELTIALRDLRQRRDELGDVKRGEAKREAFRLIKRPELPTDPTGPSRLLAITGVLVGGLGLGAAAAVSRNRYKGVFESAWQLKRRFDVGVLGTISEVMTPAERKQLSYSRFVFGLACIALAGAFGSLVIAELNDALAPLGDRLRSQLLG